MNLAELPAITNDPLFSILTLVAFSVEKPINVFEYASLSKVKMKEGWFKVNG